MPTWVTPGHFDESRRGEQEVVHQLLDEAGPLRAAADAAPFGDGAEGEQLDDEAEVAVEQRRLHGALARRQRILLGEEGGETKGKGEGERGG